MKFIISCLGLLLFCSGCSSQRADSDFRYHETKSFLGTIVQVDICAPAQEKERVEGIYRRIWARIGEIHRRLNIFDPQSELSALNRSFSQSFSASPELFSLISRAIQYGQSTDGAFEITSGVLSNVWREAEQGGTVPTKKTLGRALRFVGADKIVLGPGRQIRLALAGMNVDLGGLAAGYAADEAAQIMREDGLANFYVDMGGEIFVEGQNCRGREWRIGVRDPDRPEDVLDVLKLRNQAVSTSGSYERVYHIQGKEFSHILNPRTGYPAQDILSATVVAPTTEQADVFSTTLCLFSPQDGIRFIEKQGEGFAAMVLTRDDKGRIVRHESPAYGLLKEKK